MPHEPDRFEELFKEWARRPPTTPADEAARQVLRRLSNDRTSQPTHSWTTRSWLRTAAVVAVLVIVLTVPLYLRGPSAPPHQQDEAMNLVEAPLVPDGVALIWLDSGTPLYLTLNVPTSEGNPTS